ncbi:MAG: hypothetical protein FD121_449 [Gallionellaceae bacterium]|nr:MAG: hypothetical protein FD121_449 [Gallionellaceae bacterium]
MKNTSTNLLRKLIAALRGTRPIAYLTDMSQSLRSVRLALKSLATVSRRVLSNFLIALLLVLPTFAYAGEAKDLAEDPVIA